MEPLLTPKQAGALIGKSDEALNHMRVRGTGPAFVRLGEKRGAPIRYTRDAVTTFAASKGIQIVEPFVGGELVSA